MDFSSRNTTQQKIRSLSTTLFPLGVDASKRLRFAGSQLEGVTIRKAPAVPIPLSGIVRSVQVLAGIVAGGFTTSP